MCFDRCRGRGIINPDQGADPGRVHERDPAPGTEVETEIEQTKASTRKAVSTGTELKLCHYCLYSVKFIKLLTNHDFLSLIMLLKFLCL